MEIAADVAELADALDSGSSGRKVVEVQVLSSALIEEIDTIPIIGLLAFGRFGQRSAPAELSAQQLDCLAELSRRSSVAG
jgi:hypothetical protein